MAEDFIYGRPNVDTLAPDIYLALSGALKETSATSPPFPAVLARLQSLVIIRLFPTTERH